jgi:hypothetical protein
MSSKHTTKLLETRNKHREIQLNNSFLMFHKITWECPKVHYKKFNSGLCAAPTQESLNKWRQKHPHVPAQTLYDHFHSNKITGQK